ncbi:hypothetical protein [Deinococcus altitudinis]|uniref:hypothetical protein n=1 Tax=Deinococcus altitudinis TaxID=468914 RepID=UPI00389271C8
MHQIRRSGFVSASLLALLFSTVEAAMVMTPITAAGKGLVSAMASRYAKAPCKNGYFQSIENGQADTRRFNIEYQKAVARFNVLKAQGAYVESGKMATTFWLFASTEKGDAFLYSELRSGRLNQYTCMLQ